MFLSLEDRQQSADPGHPARSKRHDAQAFFQDEAPSVIFAGRAFTIRNLSSSGVAVAGSGVDTAAHPAPMPEVGPLIFVQRGREIAKLVVRVARLNGKAEGASDPAAMPNPGEMSIAAFAFHGEVVDLDALRRRNAQALAENGPVVPTGAVHHFGKDFSYADGIGSETIISLQSLDRQLDRIQLRIQAGDVLGAMADVRDTFRKARTDLGQAVWRGEAIDRIRAHPLAKTMLLCPLTRRSFNKPRGYPGDAVLLDQIYGLGEATLAPHPATLAGQVHFFIVHSATCRAVRYRRELLAAEIDKAAASNPNGAAILSIACGHLREIERSIAAREGRIGRLIAFDQDERSLDEVRANSTYTNLETVSGSVRSLIGRKHRFEALDLVYAAGLYDYLVDPVGIRLVERMFSFLRPGGKLLIANFTPAVEAVGYMESFMDWWLIYRTKDQLASLLSTLPKEEVGDIEVFEDAFGEVAYASVTRKAPGPSSVATSASPVAATPGGPASKNPFIRAPRAKD